MNGCNDATIIMVKAIKVGYAVKTQTNEQQGIERQ